VGEKCRINKTINKTINKRVERRVERKVERRVERETGLYYINGIFFPPISDFITYF